MSFDFAVFSYLCLIKANYHLFINRNRLVTLLVCSCTTFFAKKQQQQKKKKNKAIKPRRLHLYLYYFLFILMLFIFKSLMNHIVEICNVWAESKSYQWCLIVYTKYLQGKASILSYRRLSLILVFNSLEMLPTVFQTFPDLSTTVFSHCEGISTFPLHFKLLL